MDNAKCVVKNACHAIHLQMLVSLALLILTDPYKCVCAIPAILTTQRGVNNAAINVLPALLSMPSVLNARHCQVLACPALKHIEVC
jgi:hypothetical protein